MTTKTVYLSNPDIYETDLRSLVQLMDGLDKINDAGDTYIEEVKVHNKNGYPVGTLTLDEDFWRFTPHNVSDVEVDIDVV